MTDIYDIVTKLEKEIDKLEGPMSVTEFVPVRAGLKVKLIQIRNGLKSEEAKDAIKSFADEMEDIYEYVLHGRGYNTVIEKEYVAEVKDLWKEFVDKKLVDYL